MSAEKSKSKRAKKVKVPNIESWCTRPLGYPRLAERMGLKPETLIFRRFLALNARMLLYMQAELVELESTLQAREGQDVDDSEGKRGRYATDFNYLLLSHKDGDTTQLDLVRKIQERLKAYNKALLQQQKLCQVPAPDPFDLRDVQCILYSDAMGSGALVGEDSTVWGHPKRPKTHASDLIGVCPRQDVDSLSRVISEKAIYLFQCGLDRMKKADKHLGNVYYDSTVMKVTGWATAVMASLLPVASIIILAKIHSRTTKFWIMAAFNVLLTLCLAMCTQAKRADIFAITTAFAAVQVVFIATDGNNSTSPG